MLIPVSAAPTVLPRLVYFPVVVSELCLAAEVTVCAPFTPDCPCGRQPHLTGGLCSHTASPGATHHFVLAVSSRVFLCHPLVCILGRVLTMQASVPSEPGVVWSGRELLGSAACADRAPAAAAGASSLFPSLPPAGRPLPARPLPGVAPDEDTVGTKLG